jgi:hypothetical protein
MQKISSLLALSILLTVSVARAQTTPSAEQVLAKAKAQAAAQDKKIFLMFDASW